MLRVLLGLTAVLVLTGCAGNETPRAFSDVDHVHSVETDGERVFAGTHQGLYEWSNDQWSRAGLEFDVMGLAEENTVLFASGHPGPGNEFPDPVGILQSFDGGATWDALTLTGEVDFHLLKVSGDTMVGVAANYSSVLFSSDFGSTWTSLDLTSLSDLSLHPSSADIVLAAEGSLFSSGDGGVTFVKISDRTDVVKAQWWAEKLLVASPTTLYVASDSFSEFTAFEQRFSNILDISAHQNTIVVLDEAGVHLSTNGGTSFMTIS